MTSFDLIISKTDLTDLNWVERDRQALGDGDVRLQIQSIALTANNVTYAVFADFAGYWNFFPTGDDTKGRVPFWGLRASQKVIVKASRSASAFMDTTLRPAILL